jgi:hypothetical protein
LTLTPRGGAWDADGFGHWFYTTRSSQPAGKAPLTLWRIASDLQGFFTRQLRSRRCYLTLGKLAG